MLAGNCVGMAAPLLEGVALEKCFVQVFSNETQRLFFEILRIFNRQIGLRLDKSLGLFGRKRFAKKLVDGQQVDR